MSTQAIPAENMLRGALFALIVIPVGIIAWVVIWSFGFVVSLVAYGVAAAAVWLYQKGSGGVVSRAGVFIISGVTLVTLLLSFYFGLVVDYVRAVADVTSMSAWDVPNIPGFWTYLGEDFPTLLGDNAFGLVLALAFGVLGSFSTLRRAFKAAKHREYGNAAPALDALYDGSSDPRPYVAPTGETPAATAPTTPIAPIAPTTPDDATVPKPYAPPAADDAAPRS